MHEYTLIQDLVEQAISRMNVEKASRIKAIEVHVGKTSGYSEENLAQAFEIISAESGLKGTELVLKSIEGSDVFLQQIVLSK